MSQTAKPAIYGETPESLGERLAQWGEAPFRAKQILKWLYQKNARTPGDMSDLPKALRGRLGETFDFEPSRLCLNSASCDTTQKLLLEMRDGALVEIVVIRAPQEGVGAALSRKTLCISTQVGCAQGCRFCASGLAGWKRDLTAGEIVSEMLQACRLEALREGAAPQAGFGGFDNLVVMGMGEPLANYDNVLRALTLLNAPWGMGFGARRITLSTSGLAPQILKLAQEPLALRLAVSLHGATNEVRSQIMPVNRKYPLEVLIPAIKTFCEKKGRMATLEYILIENINDRPQDARALADIARHLHAHVNLIPYNKVESLPWKRPSPARIARFREQLEKSRTSFTLRREKGHAIDAACGQLRLKEMRKRETAEQASS